MNWIEEWKCTPIHTYDHGCGKVKSTMHFAVLGVFNHPTDITKCERREKKNGNNSKLLPLNNSNNNNSNNNNNIIQYELWG